MDFLHNVRRYVARGWTTGALARNLDGESVAPTDDDATCWCVAGAFILVRNLFCEESQQDTWIAGTICYMSAKALRDTITDPDMLKRIDEYNDTLETPDNAMTWIDKAIELVATENVS